MPAALVLRIINVQTAINSCVFCAHAKDIISQFHLLIIPGMVQIFISQPELREGR